MIQLTFLQAVNGKPLCKKFTPTEKISYPLIKSFNSIEFHHEISEQGIRDRFELIKEHAEKGCCMLKGNLKEKLENAPRGGKTNNEELARTLVLDIDGWHQTGLKFPDVLTKDHVTEYAEAIVTFLPEYLQNATYIAHASSSLGMKREKISLHLEFYLQDGVKASALKNWIRAQNFDNEMVESKLRLSNSGMSLSWVLDPALAENSRLIYIAPPEFDGLDDPFDDPDSRWVLVEKKETTVDLLPQMTGMMAARLKKARGEKINELRKAQGMDAFKPKTRMLMDRGQKVSVIQNPDELEMEFVRVQGEYAYFNVEDSDGQMGDSDAYWVRLESPEIMYNFKDEPPFEFAKANKAMYEWFMKEHGKEILSRQTVMAMVVRDFHTDKHYSILYDRPSDRIIMDDHGLPRLAEIGAGSIGGFMEDNGQPAPDPIPTWDVRFDPSSTKVADFNRDVPLLNTYSAPALIREPAALMPEMRGMRYEMGEGDTHKDIAAKIKLLCPTIYRLVWHISGADTVAFAHFINWLAWCLVNRKVATTAWIFSGTQGTGKGLFENRVLKPLVGHSYVQKITRQTVEDNFNSSLGRTLFYVVDEFRLGDSRDTGLMDKIKDWIGSETGQVRAMRVESREVKFWMNWIFFSNHTDVMQLPDDDRRFNVAPPQRVSLKKGDPQLLRELDNIPNELPAFASLLVHMDHNEEAARTCLDNDAKRNMRVASLNSAQQFCYAILHGDLDYMVEHIMVDTKAMTDVVWTQRIMAAKKLVETWMKAAAIGQSIAVEVDELQHVWQAMNPDAHANSGRFRNMLVRNDIPIRREPVNGKPTSFVEVKWRANTTDFSALSQTELLSKQAKTLFEGVATCKTSH